MRTAVADLGALASGERVSVAGRVLDCTPDGNLTLGDWSGVRHLRVDPPPADLKTGDLARIEGTLASRTPCVLTGTACERVARPHGEGDWPGRESEWRRLDGADGNRRANLVRRDRAIRIVRDFFQRRGFLEIEAPLVVPSPGLEVHLDALGTTEGTWIITSPEYQLKRLLAGGLERIFSIARCVRRGERGRHHNPEFTLLEWYRAWEPYDCIMEEAESLVAAVAIGVAGTCALQYGAELIDVTPPWERLTVREAMRRYAGLEVHGHETVEDLRAAFAARGLPLAPEGSSWDDVFFQVFLDRVEPRLGRRRPTILYEWPAPLCALARRKETDPALVERFEIYAAGLEIANAFGELTDPVEQSARLEADVAERRRRGLPVYPLDGRFLGALEEGLPPSSGIALGVDRLVMLCTGATDIREVSAFTSDEL